VFSGGSPFDRQNLTVEHATGAMVQFPTMALSLSPLIRNSPGLFVHCGKAKWSSPDFVDTLAGVDLSESE
jgi:hypothetical protein